MKEKDITELKHTDQDAKTGKKTLDLWCRCTRFAALYIFMYTFYNTSDNKEIDLNQGICEHRLYNFLMSLQVA